MDALADVSHDFIRHRVDRPHGRRKAAGLGKQALGVLADAKLAITVCEDIAIEARSDNGMLEAPLEEMLNDEGLEIDFDLELGDFALELVCSNERVRPPPVA